MIWIFRMVTFIVLSPVAVLAATWIWLTFFPPNLAPYIPKLTNSFVEQTGLNLYIEQLTLHPGFSFMLVGKNVYFSTPGQDDKILDAESIMLRFSPLQWMRGWPALSIVVDGAEMVVRRDRQGEILLSGYPIERFFAHPSKKKTVFPPIQHVALARANVQWLDETIGNNDGKVVPIFLKQANMALFFESAGDVRLNLEGLLTGPASQSPMQFSGQKTKDGRWSGRVEVERLQINSLSPYFGKKFPISDSSSPIKVAVDYLWHPSMEKFRCNWKFQTEAVNLDIPKLFRWSIPLKKLTATGALTRENHLWNLKVDRFDLANVDGLAEGHFNLTGLGGQTPFLDLSASVKGVPTDRAKIYYPAGIMRPVLVKWLDNALHDGKVEQAKVRIKGPVHGIPYANLSEKEKSETIFSIEGVVQGLGLTILKGLPELSQSQAHVTVDRLGITIKVPMATFGKNRNVSGRVRIEDMVHQPVVDVEVFSPKTDLQSIWKDIVANPEFQWDKTAGLQGAQINGQGAVKLDLKLPLHELKKSKFTGLLEFASVSLKPPFLEVPLEQTKGRLVIDADQLTLELQSGHYKGRPFSLVTEAKSYRVPGKAVLEGKIATTLDGTELGQWFAPLLGADGAVTGEVPLVLNYKNRGRTDPVKFEIFATAKANKLGITGRFDWSKSANSPGTVTLAGAVDLNGELAIQSLQLDLGNLALIGAGRWSIKRGVGQLEIPKFRLNDNSGALHLAQTNPTTSGPGNWNISAKMNWLDLDQILSENNDTQDPLPIKNAKENVVWPQIFLELSAKDFKLANSVIGNQLETQLTVENNRVTLRHLRGRIKKVDHRMHGEIHWLQQLGSGSYTGFFHLESNDVGPLFHGLDIHEALLLEGGHAELDMKLKGFLPPNAKLKKHLTGTADFNLTNGTIAKLGFLSQVLGLFSLKKLPSLVIFDRPDLTANGFSYDRVKGKVTLDESVANLDELFLDGPSMKMVLSGTVNFPEKRLNLLLGIRPMQTLDKIVSSVPLLGTLVAGNREAVVETLFDIAGPIDEPKVTIRPVASIVPGIMRDMLTRPEGSKGTPKEGKKIENGEQAQ